MEIPSPEKFIFETPLYEIIKYKEEEEEKLEDIICFDGKVDGPCIFCGKETTYKRKGNAPPRYNISNILALSSTLGLTVICSRDEKHEIEVIFKTFPEEQAFMKIGQFPSIASLIKGEISKYRKILGSNFGEFSRGIGLISHGIGIGSFVYLRRVFENLIEEANQTAIKIVNWNEEDYGKARMNEKIQILKPYLPEFLVRNNALYGIISKGIHELTEQECLDIFPAVKLGIELILDEKIKQKEQEEKEKKGAELISKIASKLNEKK